MNNEYLTEADFACLESLEIEETVYEFVNVQLTDEEWEFLASLEDAPIDYPDDEYLMLDLLP